MNKNYKGFTLAEVMIVVLIIGVVAAMTLPTLIHKYKIKQYETAFKKSSANLQNAINLALQNSGYSKIEDITNTCKQDGTPRAQDPCKSASIAEFRAFWENVLKNLKVVKKQTGGFGTQFGLGGRIKTVAGVDSDNHYMQFYGFKGCFAILNDGSTVSCYPDLHTHNNGDYYYSFDTNGQAKGPNRIGYDVFVVGNMASGCNINSTSSTSVWDGTSGACYNYALKNQALTDNAKNYWESLK